jgi:hypothetical protein
VTESLAAMVREKLDTGLLPHDQPRKLWAGDGTGKTCTACERPILSSQREYEVQYDDDRPDIRFHAACHGAWEAERRRRDYLLPSE